MRSVSSRKQRWFAGKCAVAILIAAALSGCAAPAISLERPGPSIETVVPKAPSARTPGWKGIVPGQTSRSEVERSFQPRASAGNSAVYEIDQIEAAITYARNGKVDAIELPSAVQIEEGELRSKFGPPDRTMRSDSALKVLDYDSAGLTILVEARTGKATRVRLKPASAAGIASHWALLDEMVPIRLPLYDLKKRRAIVKNALHGTAKVPGAAERDAAQQTFRQISDHRIVIGEPDLQNYLHGLALRLASVTPTSADLWRVYAIEGSVPQGMNLGGGYILVTRGFLSDLETEAQLAFILCHEMAHQLNGDVASEATRQAAASLVVIAGAIAAGVFGGETAARQTMRLGSLAAEIGLAPFSREQEAQADILALYILETAGYDPRQAVPVMDRLVALRDKYGHPISILATHPGPEVRMAQVRQWLAARDSVDYSDSLVTTREFIEIRERFRAKPR